MKIPCRSIVVAAALLGLLGWGSGSDGHATEGPSATSPAIRLVYWDVGNVLVNDVNAAKRAGLANAYGLDLSAVEQCYNTFRRGADLGWISDCEFWLTVAGCAGMEPSKVRLAGPLICHLRSHIQPIPGALGLFHGLRDLGIPAGILSDDSREMGLAKAEVAGYLHTAAILIISGFHGLKKPDLPIFQLALTAAKSALGTGLQAGNLLFIDDNPDNIAGASAAGFQTIRFQSPAQVCTELRERFGIVADGK